MDNKRKSDIFIEESIGCGRFQVIFFVIVVVLVKVTCAYTVLFMAFGNYNPGWRCMDNRTVPEPMNSTENWMVTLATNTTTEFAVGSCEDYKACRQVEFNPETSTIVTEFGLICDSAWKSSMVISIQATGMLVGSFVGGQLADLFGRKRTLYGAVAFGAILELLSSFSVSWAMFTTIRFLLGFCMTCNIVNLYLYMAEVMTIKWRATVMALPSWQVGTTILSVSAMISKNWRTMELIGLVLFVLAFIPVIWVPESLRWLEVKGRTKELTSTAQKMAKFNKRVWRPINDIEPVKEHSKHIREDKKYTIKDIFRKGYRFSAFGVAFLPFSFSLIYYSLSFGVKSLYGDFYFNLILMSMIDIPFNFISMFTLKYISRRRNCILFLGFFAICVFVTAILLLSNSETAKAMGSTVLISIGKGSLEACWYCVYARTAELFPTVARGIGLGWSSSVSRLGGIIAPFLIPNDKGSWFIYMIAMGILALVCCVVSIVLPETKGKLLKERFDDEEAYYRRESGTSPSY